MSRFVFCRRGLDARPGRRAACVLSESSSKLALRSCITSELASVSLSAGCSLSHQSGSSSLRTCSGGGKLLIPVLPRGLFLAAAAAASAAAAAADAEAKPAAATALADRGAKLPEEDDAEGDACVTIGSWKWTWTPLRFATDAGGRLSVRLASLDTN